MVDSLASPPALARSSGGVGPALPALLTSSTSPTNPPRSSLFLRLAAQHYGAQLHTSSLPLHTSIKGQIPTSSLLRRLQVNQFVTSGVAPSGKPSSFRSLSDTRKAQEDQTRRQAVEAIHRDAVPSEGDYLDSVLIRSPLVKFRSALLSAALCAVKIRGEQLFTDGNHRTALLSFVVLLAEHGITLTSRFNLFRAYYIVSALDHLGNQGNMLDAQATEDTAAELVRYTRHRSRRAVPSWSYVEALARRIQELPLRASEVEETYQLLRVRTLADGSEFTRHDQWKGWRALTRETRVNVKRAHSDFTPIA